MATFHTQTLWKWLNFLRPALASVEFLPILSKVCFDKHCIFAYNDVFAAVVEVDVSEMPRIAVDGQLLYKLINQCEESVETISMRPVLAKQGSKLVIAAGSTIAELPIVSDDEFVFKCKEATTFKKDNTFTKLRKLLSDDLRAVAATTAQNSLPAYSSVTLLDGALLATNGGNLMRLKYARVKGSTIEGAHLLPADAVAHWAEALDAAGSSTAEVVISKTNHVFRVKVSDESTEGAGNAATAYTVVSKLVTDPPPDYNRILKLVQDVPRYGVPAGLDKALEASEMFTGSDGTTTLTVSSARAGKERLLINTRSSKGQVSNELRVPAGIATAFETKKRVAPSAIRRAIKLGASRMAVCQHMLVFFDEEERFLLAVADVSASSSSG